MRSKFKDEHPFGELCFSPIIRDRQVLTEDTQRSARLRLSALGRSIRTGYLYVEITWIVVKLALISSSRSFARRRTRLISRPSTRRNILSHLLVHPLLIVLPWVLIPCRTSL